MEHFNRILENNRKWVSSKLAENPQFFSRLAEGQEPHFLFIGCSDSRVPADAITGTGPGEMFVHRNIANQVFPSDINVLSVLQYAVEVLDVEHVIVCGHYGCGGVKAATGPAHNGLVDNWLGTIRDVLRWNAAELEAIDDEKLRLNRLVELNVIQQVYNLSRTPAVQQAWEKRRRPLLHGLVYELAEGLLRPLVVAVDSNEKAHALFRREETHAHPPGGDGALVVGSSGNRTATADRR
jgi:carbonic anhydrase